MKKLLFGSLAVIMLYSCSNNQKDTSTSVTDSIPAKDSLQKQLIGDWSYTSLKVTINTALNGDSTGLIDVNESNWERVLNTKPWKNVFNEDGTYYSEYRSLSDSIIRGSEGTWYVIKDSLFMNQKQPNIASFDYKVTIDNGLGQFSGIVDWEGDGKEDDEYLGILKK